MSHTTLVSTQPTNQPIHTQVRGSAKVKPAIIVSYEMFVKIAPMMKSLSRSLLICDEGHRLKSSNLTKTMQALCTFPSMRRLIITGTPIQNDLQEFYNIVNFVNPTVLGSPETFRNVYAKPIMRGRDMNASKRDRDLGESRSKELSDLTSKFILRRTSEVLRNSLPPKHEHVVFCKMTETQITTYAPPPLFLSLSLFEIILCKHSQQQQQQLTDTTHFFEIPIC